MKRWVIAVVIALFPVITEAVPTLVFDTVPGGAGGTMTYDGAGGPLIGDNIAFVEIMGVDTPLNSGAVLACTGCLLDFATGANIQEGPGQLWIWDGGGNFTLTGDVPSLGLTGATLISGTFTGTANTPGLAGDTSSALFISLGVDSKDPTLAGFFGLSPDGFTFANTEIALDTFTLGANGAFSAIPNQADIINTQVALVPNPMTMLLLGVGMAGLAIRKQFSA